jgi:hypothetical protein
MGALLAATSHARLTHIPYKGSAPAISDLLSKEVDSVILTVAAVDKLVDAGSLRALAVSSTQRVRALPAVPTLAESGFNGMSDTGWFAVFVPAKTPRCTPVGVAGPGRRGRGGPDEDAGTRPRAGGQHDGRRAHHLTTLVRFGRVDPEQDEDRPAVIPTRRPRCRSGLQAAALRRVHCPTLLLLSRRFRRERLVHHATRVLT